MTDPMLDNPLANLQGKPKTRAEATSRGYRTGVAHWRWWEWAVVSLVSALLLALLVTVFTGSNDDPTDQQVENALNYRYTQTIQYATANTGGRYPQPTQTLVIDGILRTDCHVPDAHHPTIECDQPVTLTPQR